MAFEKPITTLDEVLPEVIELTMAKIHEWHDDGDDFETGLDRLALALDSAIKLEALIGAPLGVLLDDVADIDGKAIRLALNLVVDFAEAIRPDPDRLRARAAKAEAKGRHRVAARRRKRAARIEAG